MDVDVADEVLTDETSAFSEPPQRGRAATLMAFEDRFEALGLSQLIESGHNPRHHFDAAKLADLAASIAQKGVIEPLVVRPIQTLGLNVELFEIVAGARRYRAAKLAGVTHVPCVIRRYTDEDVLELTVIENIQRDDLDPLEEAAGYRALIDANPARYSAAYIAERIGKSEKYVWDRMKLLDLVPEAKAHLQADRIHPGHAILLARLKADDQQRALAVEKGGVFVREALLFEPGEEGDPTTGEERPSADPYHGWKAVTVRELEKWIAEHVRFDVVHAATAAPLEFGPAAVAVDQARLRPGRGKKVVAITHDHFVKEDARDPAQRTFTTASWKRADGRFDSKTCAAAVLGVVAVGPEYGSAFEVCLDKACDVHWKAERRERERQAKSRTSAETRRETRETAAKEAWTTALPDILDALAAKLKTVKPSAMFEMVLRAVDHSWNATYLKQAIARMKAPKTQEDVIRVAAFTVLAERAQNWQGHINFPKEAKAWGIDTKTFLAGGAKAPQTSAVAKRAAKPAAKKKAGRR